MKKGGSVVASDTVKTAGTAAKVTLTADRSSIRVDGNDLVSVIADVQDASGVFVPDASNSIAFAVTGPGQLVGVDNGNAADTTTYKSASGRAFSGKALATVRSTGAAGQITVTATTSGLTAGSVYATAN